MKILTLPISLTLFAVSTFNSQLKAQDKDTFDLNVKVLIIDKASYAPPKYINGTMVYSDYMALLETEENSDLNANRFVAMVPGNIVFNEGKKYIIRLSKGTENYEPGTSLYNMPLQTKKNVLNAVLSNKIDVIAILDKMPVRAKKNANALGKK